MRRSNRRPASLTPSRSPPVQLDAGARHGARDHLRACAGPPALCQQIWTATNGRGRLRRHARAVAAAHGCPYDFASSSNALTRPPRSAGAGGGDHGRDLTVGDVHNVSASDTLSRDNKDVQPQVAVHPDDPSLHQRVQPRRRVARQPRRRRRPQQGCGLALPRDQRGVERADRPGVARLPQRPLLRPRGDRGHGKRSGASATGMRTTPPPRTPAERGRPTPG